MNAVMLELYKQAHVPCTAIDPSNNMPYESTCFSAEKFSELIVKECAWQCDILLSHTISKEWQRGTHECALHIRHHFGVET